MRVFKDIRPMMIVTSKDICRLWEETADIDKFEALIAQQKPVEWAIEYYYQKPLKACSLQEVVDCIVLNIKIQNFADSVKCTSNDHCYEICLNHLMGLKNSQIVAIMNESALKTYGAMYESHYSERRVFFKIYKKGQACSVPEGGVNAVASAIPARAQSG